MLCFCVLYQHPRAWLKLLLIFHQPSRKPENSKMDFIIFINENIHVSEIPSYSDNVCSNKSFFLIVLVIGLEFDILYPVFVKNVGWSLINCFSCLFWQALSNKLSYIMGITNVGTIMEGVTLRVFYFPSVFMVKFT